MRSDRHHFQRLMSMLGSVALTLVLATHAQANDEVRDPRITVEATTFVGRQDANGVASFQGIPYAQAPVGDRRWQRPQPWQFSPGDRDASAFAPACMQSGSGLAWYHGMMRRVGINPAAMTGPSYSEDCLYLNIWTDLAAEGPRPVLLFIHGGSNTGGWSYEPNYHGQSLVKKGLIVVTVAYRLGVFGWLSHPDMDLENPALHDLAMSLDWVYQHIAQFGGDPTRITIAGESSGATNALHLAISPLSQGRVSGVIHQSGGWPLDGTPSPAEASQRGTLLAEALLGADATLTQLRQVPAEALMKASQSVYANFQFDPIEDPESLPDTLKTLAIEKRMPPLTMIIGSNVHESLMYVEPHDQIENYLTAQFSTKKRQRMVDYLKPFKGDKEKINQLSTATDFLCPSLRLASLVHQSGGRAWVYRFDRIRPGFEAIGAYHGAELPYVFDRHDAWLPSAPADTALTASIVDYWSAFIAEQVPSSATGPAWPAWSDQQPTMIFDQAAAVSAHPDRALCNLLASH